MGEALGSKSAEKIFISDQRLLIENGNGLESCVGKEKRLKAFRLGFQNIFVDSIFCWVIAL